MTSHTAASLPLSPVTPTRFALARLGVIRLTGIERVKYLQGQVTCDVQALSAGQHSLGAHCDAKGKVWCVFRLLVLDDALLLLTEQSLLPRTLTELKKYGVFAKVEIQDASAEYQLIGVAGSGSDAWMQQHHGVSDTAPLTAGMAVRLDADRWLLLSQATLACELPEQPESDWWGLEMLAGLPHLNAEHQGEFIPQMLNLQALGGICFTKGCYMGQETVARAKYRGANHRGLFILQGRASQPLQVTDALEIALGEQWKRSGQILDLWQRDEQVLLTAVLPLDTEPEARFRCKDQPDSALQLRPLPYSLEE